MYTKSILIPVVTETPVSLPEYESAGASGMDVRSELTLVNTKFLFDASLDLDKNQVTINPGGRALIPTGIHVAIPEGYEIQVRPRSGLALKKGITVLNTPGTIDADYRGGIGVILINHSNEQRNRLFNKRYQNRNHFIFCAFSNSCMEFRIFMQMIFALMN